MKLRMALPTMAALLVAVHAVALAAPSSPNEVVRVPCRASSAPDSPLGLIRRFEQAYECGDFDAYAVLFTNDFRFLSEDPQFRTDYPEGMTREDELRSARHLFYGNTKEGGEHVPLAVKIDLRFDSLAVVDDPVFPESSWSHQMVIALGVSLVIDVGGNYEIVSLGDRNEFRVVRGEAADLGAGQASDADHWYFRKWIEREERAPQRWTTWAPIRSFYR